MKLPHVTHDERQQQKRALRALKKIFFEQVSVRHGPLWIQATWGASR